MIVSKEEIAAEAERLASLPAPVDGRRESLIVHPQADARSPGLAPGIQVKLSVLKPGEQSKPFRHNATEVNFCIGGSGHAIVGGRRIDFRQYDVWNHPSYATVRARQRRQGPAAAPDLLQHSAAAANGGLRARRRSAGGQGGCEAQMHADAADPRRRSPYGMIAIGTDGGLLMPYETLINPTVVESRPLHFPWAEVKAELDKLVALGKDYVGRRLYMMYNPVTGRHNGITPNFFATMTIRPPKIVDRPHRHVSAAINYYFKGSGYSVVAGNRYEWKAGDLMLSAPGWAVHNHASYDEPVYELTVQDQPLNIYMESILWQEDMKKPAALLGSELGFDTNRDKVAA